MLHVLIRLLITIIVSIPIQTFSQKKPISNTSYTNWSKLDDYAISNDGKFVLYKYTTGKDSKVVLTSTDLKYKITLNGGLATFSKDSHYILFTADTAGKSRLGILKIGAKQPFYISNIDGYYFPNNIKSDYFFYYSKDTLNIQKIGELASMKYPASTATMYSEGEVILIKRKNQLLYKDLVKKRECTITNDLTAYNFSVDNNCTKVVFLTDSAKNIKVYYWMVGMKQSKEIANSFSAGIRSNYFLKDNLPRFSDDGNFLWLQLGFKQVINPDSGFVYPALDIWTYKDKTLMSHQLLSRKQGSEREEFAAVVDLKNERLIQIETKDSVISSQSNHNGYAILIGREDITESYLHPERQRNYHLVSLEDGSQKLLVPCNSVVQSPLFSPSGKFVFWLDKITSQYWSYEISTGIRKNVSTGGGGCWIRPKSQDGYTYPYGGYCYSWIQHTDQVLIEDQYDVWKIDLSGKLLPVCLTNGYGRAHHIEFRMAGALGFQGNPLKDDEKIVLRAIQQDYYKSGFATIKTGSAQNPKMGKLDNVFYSGEVVGHGHPLIKAKNASIYLAVREASTEAPNLFVTNNFNNYRQLSKIAPQKEYNWLSSELITYNMPNGKVNKAILYKPENFDPSQKYPVIFHYYQMLSPQLNVFLNPELSGSTLNIPWYVSNGYLVCVTDIINDEPGKIANTTVQSVEGAAKHLIQFPYVNSRKLGLQGHSFGGYETNILVANSRLFTAAQSSAGTSDLFREVGDVAFGETSLVAMAEIGQFNMRSSPYSNFDGYVKNSPIFQAPHITTPLLIQNNIGDNVVSFGQGLSFFNALRRFNKPVWLLQYDFENHNLGEEASLDFIVRQQQFFDHYLKDKPAPIWMTKGIPAELKGVQSGLQFDTSTAQQ